MVLPKTFQQFVLSFLVSFGGSNWISALCFPYPLFLLRFLCVSLEKLCKKCLLQSHFPLSFRGHKAQTDGFRRRRNSAQGNFPKNQAYIFFCFVFFRKFLDGKTSGFFFAKVYNIGRWRGGLTKSREIYSGSPFGDFPQQKRRKKKKRNLADTSFHEQFGNACSFVGLFLQMRGPLPSSLGATNNPGTFFHCG